MKPEKRTVATLTNAAYLLAGVYLYLQGWIVPAVAVLVLGMASGIYHYYLTEWTQKLDFAGMYATLLGLASLLTSYPPLVEIAVVGGASILLVLLLGASRTFIMILIGLVLAALMWVVDIKTGLEVASFMAIAFVFNALGDRVHTRMHSLIHGLGWHVPTAYAILLAAEGLA